MRPGRSPFPDLVGLYSDEATAVTPTEVTAEAASAGPSFSDFTGLTSSEDDDIAAIRERYFQSLNLQNILDGVLCIERYGTPCGSGNRPS